MANEANTDSLALRPATLPMGNLQNVITHTLLPSATGVNEPLPRQDFNLLE